VRGDLDLVRYIRVENEYLIPQTEACALASEGEVKISTTIAVGLAILLSGSLAAYAQTEPTVHHHVHHYVGPHHTIHHHYVEHNPAEAPAPAAVVATPAPQAAPFGLALPHIAPYPDGKGDEDGMSEDEDDCNKGCIDGNTPD
jgi:hypothetical protein